jgi:hypothetical protein
MLIPSRYKSDLNLNENSQKECKGWTRCKRFHGMEQPDYVNGGLREKRNPRLCSLISGKSVALAQKVSPGWALASDEPSIKV